MSSETILNRVGGNGQHATLLHHPIAFPHFPSPNWIERMLTSSTSQFLAAP